MKTSQTKQVLRLDHTPLRLDVNDNVAPPTTAGDLELTPEELAALKALAAKLPVLEALQKRREEEAKAKTKPQDQPSSTQKLPAIKPSEMAPAIKPPTEATRQEVTRLNSSKEIARRVAEAWRPPAPDNATTRQDALGPDAPSSKVLAARMADASTRSEPLSPNAENVRRAIFERASK